MNKNIFLRVIIAIFLVFSIKNTFASDYLLEDVLNLEVGPYSYDLSTETLDTYYFSQTYLKNKYDKVVLIDKALRNQIIRAMNLGTLDSTKGNYLIKNYKAFLYETNTFFYYLNVIEKNSSLKNDIGVQEGTLKAYKSMSIYYSNMMKVLK